jgi:AcrR family transcriptional regulator
MLSPRRLGQANDGDLPVHALAGSARPEHPEAVADRPTRERIADIQRTRMLAAMFELALEGRAASATVADIVARSGVSRRTFYEIFSDREDCFLAAFEAGIARAFSYLACVYDPRAKWLDRIRAGLTALLEYLDTERGTARLLVVESLGAGAEVLGRRSRALTRIIAAVDEGREQAKGSLQLSPLTAEGIVGGAVSVIHARLLDRRPGRLVELNAPLMGMIVLPYLGPAAARRELGRPVPQCPQADRHIVGDPLRELGMRLTYRTVRVLLSVAAERGLSNREVGLAAGIADQGQISKLLSRLQRLGLVQNTGLAPGKGAPNSWTLTAKGAEVERAMSTDTGPQERVMSVGANSGSGR